MQKLLVVVPTFNERQNIEQLAERVFALHDDADLLVVDDASPDGTAATIEELQQRYPDRLHLLKRAGKQGRGSAVLAGFRFALDREYQFIMEMDADFSHKPEEIARFLEKMNEAPIVVGSRYLPESRIFEWGWKRTFFSKWANRFARTVLRLPLTDFTNGFRCYTREAITALEPSKIDAKGYVVLSEVAYQLHHKGFALAEVPTVFVNRRRGISNLTMHEVREAFLSVLRIRFPRTTLHIEQFAKFAICGGGGATIDLGTLTVQVELLGIAPEIAFIPSTFLAVLFVFFANKHFTFRNRERHYGSQLMKFAMVYGVAIVMNNAISYALLWLGVHYLLSRICAIGVGAFWNYSLSHGFVFKKNEDVDVAIV